MRAILACFLFLIAAPLWAESRVALVIGVGDYTELRPLANPRNDARAMDEVLYDLGFDVDVVTDRDRDRLTRALQDFAEYAAGADLALIYFAGHGMEVAGENLLFARDAQAGSLEGLRDTALPLSDMVDAVLGADAGLLLIDACRTDAFGVPVADDNRGGFSFRQEKVSPGFGRIGRADNLLYAFAAAPGQGALDGEGENSPFAASLVRHLGTEGLEIRTALTLVQQDVYDRTRGVQLPYVESGLPELVFAAGTAALPEREQLLLAMSGVGAEDRMAVERIAGEFDMPLAPLFGALFTASLGDVSFEDRDQQLRQAAEAFARVRDDLRTLSSDDPEVTALRQEAERQLSLGAFDAARAALTQAAEIDNTSRQTLRDNYRARTLSEAETHYLNAETALADLRRDLAIEDYGKAVELFEEVLALDGGEGVQKRHFHSLEKLGDAQVISGDLTSARNSFERMSFLAEKMVQKKPTDTDWLRILSISHERLGSVFRDSGDLTAAREAYEAGLEISVSLAARDPGNTEWQSDLSFSHNKMGDVARVSGDLEAAHEAYEAALRIRAGLAARDTGNTRWQRDLSASHDRLGDVARANGDLVAARMAYEAALGIRADLAARDRGNTQWQRDLSASHDRLGDVARANGDLVAARMAYEAVLEIATSLVARDPGNTEWQRDLSVSHNKLGDVTRASGDLAAALLAHEEGLEIATKLATRDPGNTQWQRDLSISHYMLADVFRDSGDLAAARVTYKAGLEILAELTAHDPDNAEWLWDLVVIHYKLSNVVEDPMPHLESALHVADELEAAGRLSPSQIDGLNFLREEVARLQAEVQD